jgi:thiol-disulfide isomerase/thioredoxin
MKKLFSTFALSLGLFAAAHAQYDNTYIKVGQKAPDLAYPNPDGKVIKLSEVNKGSYVLLDFWASWCGPCRHANPGLVKMYKEYTPKKFKNAKNGLKIVSVSLDKTKDAWVRAIQQDGLTWPNHMSDLQQWNSQPAAAYGVQFIPQAFLIDPKGKIVGVYHTAEESENDIKKLVAE